MIIMNELVVSLDMMLKGESIYFKIRKKAKNLRIALIIFGNSNYDFVGCIQIKSGL